jgi:Ca2+-binding RTX toxin-like protein
MRRRAILLITAVAVALVVASGVTLADDVECKAGTLCTGTDRADTMTGTPQADNMNGLGGNDTLKGLGGNDTYTFSANWGADLIPADGEGAGKDTLDFSLLVQPQPLDVDLVSSADRDEVFSVYAGAGMLNFPATVQIEDVKGGQVRDVVRGNDGINQLSGELGNDSLYGRGGADVLIGGPGADALIGGAGNDVNVNDGLGNDTVYGDNPEVPTETGDDKIDVKDGQPGDTVDCGPGTDTVYVDVNPVGTELSDTYNNCERVNPPE